MKNKKNSQLVYSTEGGRICPECGKYSGQCVCHKKKAPQSAIALPTDGIVRIRRETSGRGGKTVSAIYGLPKNTNWHEMARRLKQRCGTGGSVKEGIIMIQGDHREILQAELVKIGYTVKLAGG